MMGYLFAMNKLFNAAVGIPAPLRNLVGLYNLSLRWSRHAMQEAVRDHYGVLKTADYARVFKLSEGWELVEIEATQHNHIVKIVVRRAVPNDPKARSLVLAIEIEGPREGLVKTCWTNLNSDKHATLDTSKFSKE